MIRYLRLDIFRWLPIGRARDVTVRRYSNPKARLDEGISGNIGALRGLTDHTRMFQSQARGSKESAMGSTFGEKDLTFCRSLFTCRLAALYTHEGRLLLNSIATSTR